MKTNTNLLLTILLASQGIIVGLCNGTLNLYPARQQQQQQQDAPLKAPQVTVLNQNSIDPELPSIIDPTSSQPEHLQLIEAVAPVALKFEQKCIPMLNLQALLSMPGSKDPKTITTGDVASALDKFSFAIGDIEMPVAPSEGSISSAMKLLSSFGNQFEPQEPATEDPVNAVKFRDNHLQIQGLNLTMLNVHLFSDSEPKFGVGILIKNTTLNGRFTYNGPIQLSGFYRMSIDNVYLVASSNLTRQRVPATKRASETLPIKLGDQSDIVDSVVALRTNDFRMNITNLGFISIDIFDSMDSSRPTTNYLLRMLQRLLQKTIKRTYYSFENYIRETLEKESRHSLDCELSRFTHLLDSTGITSGHQQQNYLSRILSTEILRSHLDTVTLPDFSYQQQLFGSAATIMFYNGSLAGLERIKLNGETRIKLEDEHLFVNTSVGWSDLRPYYNWSLFLGSGSRNPSSSGHVLFNVRAIDFDAVITKGIKPHTNIVVDQLIIKRLDNPKMDIIGLPGMNRVTRGMVNFFMGRLKQRLALSMLPSLKQQLEWSLNKMNIFSSSS